MKRTISTSEYIEAAKELGEAKMMLNLAKNNAIAMEIVTCGKALGTCDNKYLVPAIKNQIKQINLFLRGKKNKWE